MSNLQCSLCKNQKWCSLSGFEHPKCPKKVVTETTVINVALDEYPYGYCPTCGAPGISRERRLNGDDRCEKGHVYPSKDAAYNKR